jgi:putative ABC transport system ATP-binding protein
MTLINIRNLTKTYRMGDTEFIALDNVDVQIGAGEYVAIVGPSGSGKSTLMNMLGCLDVPTSGEYFLNGQDVSKMNETQLAKVRNKNIGFVFQRYNLMGRTSALRNVELPVRYAGLGARERHERATAALNAVGLSDKMKNMPSELSGGQQQRVAIARALVNNPSILMADEPTGALDSKTGKEVLELFEQLHRERGITVIVVTHDPGIARRAQRMISIKDGCIESDIAAAELAHVAPSRTSFAAAAGAGTTPALAHS